MKQRKLINIKILWSKYKRFLGTFFSKLSKWEKTGFIVLNIFLSGYIVFTRYTAYSNIFVSKLDTLFIALISLVYTFLLFNFLIFIFGKLKGWGIEIYKKQAHLDGKVFLIAAGICLVILLVALMAYYPGGISPDCIGQWKQVHSFTFDDWHPVIHTFLIYLVTRIYDNYSFVVFVQILIFSLGIGYLISTLKAWGFSKWWLILVEALILLNPLTRNMMMFVWKDVAFTIAMIFLVTQCINIFLSKGEWLRSKKNVVLLGICLALASLFRHNGIFITIPLVILIVIMYFKEIRHVIWVAIVMIAGIFLIKGPLYSYLKVTYPDNTLQESVGIPMTIMGDVLIENPKALSSETHEFLNTIASDEQWAELYKLGNYNSIKFHSQASQMVKELSAKEILSMTWDTVKADPRTSYLAVKELTDMVWDTKENDDVKRLTVYVTDGMGYSYNSTEYNKVGKVVLSALNTATDLPVLNTVFKSLGIHILLLMVVTVFAFYTKGWKSLLISLPFLIYDFGTMLLLCGNDSRFFNFNVVLVVPVCLVLLSKQLTKAPKVT